jgi:RNA polymerase sigma-70 factor, ECF subfamily
MLEPTPRHAMDASNAPCRAASAAGESDGLPDLLLIERARQADERAIETLIRRYARRLLRVTGSVLNEPERAERAVLEAYLAAFGDLSRYESTGKFAAWLTRLAFEQARLLRSADAAPEAAAAQARPAAGTPAELEQAIAHLPEVFRTVYVLRAVEGVSGIETAASLGLHETTVRTRFYRAHRRLGAEFTQRIQGTPGLLEPAAASIERLVHRARSRIAQGSILSSSASSP